MKKLILFGLAGGLTLAGVAADTPTLDLPPYTFTGRVMDWRRDNQAVKYAATEVRAYVDKSLVGVAKVVETTASAYNFALQVPVASSRAKAKAAVVGDEVHLVVDDGESIYTLTGTDTAIKKAGGITALDVVVAQDSDGNGIADEYERIMSDLLDYYIAVEGLKISKNPDTLYGYDPDADYDGDGVSNRDEYLAGTNPFVGGDSFRIVAVKPSEENPDYMELTFVVSENRTYTLQMGERLANEELRPGKFALKAKNTPTESVINTKNATIDPEVTKTVFVLKNGDSSFYRVNVK